MSIKVQDKTCTEDSLTIYGYSGDIEIQARDGGKFASGLVDRAEFFTAVATECNVRIVPATEPLADWELELMGRKTVPADAIVIERGELPEVTEVNGWLEVNGYSHPITHAGPSARDAALRYLAVDAWRTANPPKPPVDEAQVAALTDALEAAGVMVNPAERARRLYLAGVRVEATS